MDKHLLSYCYTLSHLYPSIDSLMLSKKDNNNIMITIINGLLHVHTHKLSIDQLINIHSILIYLLS